MEDFDKKRGSLVIIFSLFFFFASYAQGFQELYFDRFWNVVDEENYYIKREINEQGNTIVVEDFYKYGTTKSRAIILAIDAQVNSEIPGDYIDVYQHYYLNKKMSELIIYDIPKYTSVIEDFYGELSFLPNDKMDEFTFKATFYKNGVLQECGFYEKGYEEGYNKGYRFLNYNKKGGLESELNYSEGVLNGVSRYYTNNRLLFEINYVDGIFDGFFKGYDYKNGNVLEEGIYVDGYKDGWFKYYSESGELERSIKYLYDDVIDEDY